MSVPTCPVCGLELTEAKPGQRWRCARCKAKFRVPGSGAAAAPAAAAERAGQSKAARWAVIAGCAVALAAVGAVVVCSARRRPAAAPGRGAGGGVRPRADLPPARTDKQIRVAAVDVEEPRRVGERAVYDWQAEVTNLSEATRKIQVWLLFYDASGELVAHASVVVKAGPGSTRRVWEAFEMDAARLSQVARHEVRAHFLETE